MRSIATMRIRAIVLLARAATAGPTVAPAQESPPATPTLPQEAPRKEPRRRPPPAPQPVRSRAAPLGGRAAVRRAIIAMNILGPCRGLEEPPPGQPEGSLQQGARRH
jgi:hypothetical protein